MNYKNIAKGILLVWFGMSLTNIIWYLRLSNPIMMREFMMYFEELGAKTFLMFNVFYIIPLVLMMIVYLIYLMIEKRKKKNNSVKQGESVKW